MSGNDPQEKPAIVSMGTIVGALGLLVAGMAAWMGMNERVTRLEATSLAFPQAYATKSEVSGVEARVTRKLDRITDLLCDDQSRQTKRACKEQSE